MGKSSQKTYWPHMILGFLMLAIVLGYWTVKTAVSLPVQETNDYMMKYQDSDLHINDILDKKMAFDKLYDIKIIGTKRMVMTDNIYSHRVQKNPVVLKEGENSFSYIVTTKSGDIVKDANASFLLTRPHTQKDDVMIKVVNIQDGKYTTPELNITKAGRYTLQFRAIIDDKTVGYSSIEAYLVPKKQ